MATGIALVAPAFVRGVLGAQWVAMIPVVRVFAAWGLLRSLVALCGPLFRAVDHPEYSTIMQLTRLGLLAAFIYPATAMWGSAGAAAAVLASGVVQNPVALWLAVRTLDSSPYRLLRTLASPVGASLVMAGAVLAVTAALTGLSPTALFLTQVLVGVIAYGAVLAVGERTVGLGLARDAALLRDGLS
jgi:PST family polysaccharide transporter/lipopolysaccharide exporter